MKKNSFYAKYIKRILDFTLSLIALIVLSPILLLLTVTGAIAMKGNPFFVQKRPGKIDPKTGKERIFSLIKFRTMDNRRDSDGNLLPDEVRLNKYGRFLRKTSFDELPELFNILIGQMSIVGPRPLLVRDMVFMNSEQRRRHTVPQGLTGLAQVNGRNNMTWVQKLNYDLLYIDDGITFFGDIKILLLTVVRVLQCNGITEDGSATATDYGDYLLQNGEVTEEEYNRKHTEAKELLLTN